MTPTQPQGIPLKDAAAATGLTEWQLRKLAYRGGIRHRKSGRRLVFHPEDVQALANAAWKGSPVNA